VAVSPMGGPEGLWSGNQPQFPDIGGYGNHEYGNRVGIFRILTVLDKYAIPPTLALDAAVADHYPTLVNEGQKRGAEFIAHGLSRRRMIHIGMSADEEREYIRASIDAVERATGTRPVGWSGPDFQETPNTPHLLAAERIRYVCDWRNDEQPYRMTPKTGDSTRSASTPISTTTISTCTAGARSTKSTCCGASGSTGSMPTARPPGG
jgi:peptidoglycan/xylan/chitin deacetylase (PgdA/CDA1 family)